MIVTSSQNQIALRSQAISLESSPEDAFLIAGNSSLYAGDRSLSVRVASTVVASKDGLLRVGLPITPLLVQNSLSDWDKEIMDIYNTPESNLNTSQAYVFSGWDASVRVSAQTIPTLCTLGAQDVLAARTEQNGAVSSWVKDAMVEDGEFSPHLVEENACMQYTSSNSVPLCEGCVVREIFVPQSTALLVGESKTDVGPIINCIYTSTDIAGWKFTQSDWLKNQTYPVFGEVVIETVCKKGERIIVEIDVTINVTTSIDRIFVEEYPTQYEEYLIHEVFSGSKSITSTHTLILPGPWLIGKTKWNAFAQNILNDQKQMHSTFISCIVRIRNTARTETVITFRVMTPIQESEGATPIPLSFSGTEAGFGIVPDAASPIETVLSLENVEQKTYSLVLKSNEEVMGSFSRNVFDRPNQTDNNLELNSKFEIIRQSESATVIGISDSPLMYITGEIFSPWVDFNDGNSPYVPQLYFPFFLAVETQSSPSLQVSVDFVVSAVSSI